jgi:hypothetical protein
VQKLLAAAAGIAAVAVTAVPASAQDAENMRLVANYDDGGTYRNGTDMAFWGDTLLLGNLDQGTGPNASPPGGFRVMDIANPAQPREIGQHVCLGDQSDVSMWGDIVVLSVDKPTFANCKDGDNTWEGLRIISLADPANPQILATIRTDCGSHTNTIYPDLENGRLLVYVLSYPLAGRYNPAQVMPTCNVVTHRKISVVSVPLDNPENAELIGTPSTGNTIGCHDVTVFLERQLAAAACLTESQIWDLSKDPANPEIVATIQDPGVNIHHSTAFSNDGNTLVIGDELGGAAASPGCLADGAYEQGGLFFYDVSDPRAPERRGSYKLPRSVVSEFCTAHLFNVVPRKDEQDVLVSSWYAGSTSVIDFTDPTAPEEIAHYIPPATVTPDSQTKEAAAWSSYWYNGNVFANNFDEDVNSLEPQSRGLDVFAVDHPLVQKGTVELSRLNPQLQEPFGGGRGKQRKPPKRR